jgi:anaerobic ribonucleoside-triphosphate reductase activating protein
MKYLKITGPGVNNGDGCRITLWLPGCTHKCPGCHNAHTHDYNQGQEFNEDTFNKLIEKLDKTHIQGLTISGGDPLDQSNEVLDDLYSLLYRLRNCLPEKDIWLYTGFYIDKLGPKQIDVVDMCDVVVDGPYIQSKRDISLPFRGSENQTIIKILKGGLNN